MQRSTKGIPTIVFVCKPYSKDNIYLVVTPPGYTVHSVQSIRRV